MPFRLARHSLEIDREGAFLAKVSFLRRKTNITQAPIL